MPAEVFPQHDWSLTSEVCKRCLVTAFDMARSPRPIVCMSDDQIAWTEAHVSGLLAALPSTESR